jgi:SNF2 family DNA or RNA helicase
MKVGGFAMKVAMKVMKVSVKPPARTAAQRRLEKAGCASPGKGAKKKFSAELTTPPRRQSSGLLDGQTPQALLPKKMRLDALPDASQKLKKSGVPEARKGAMGRNSILQMFKTSEFSSSTKVEAVLDEVEKMRKKSDKSKALIFSQFSAMLELIEFRLKRAGISCLVFRGGMSIEARDNALRIFRTDPTVKVILISLKAGGEGLNLQVADHVFLVDPWWNPACELQAIQRAHRIGQTREVKAVRFICTDTVEERMLALQEKKQLVFDGTVGGSQGAISKLTEQDLHFLFQH